MADEGETIEQRHKREQKELQAKIQALKHSVPKGDKKRKKQVTIEIAQLEAELDQRQQDELTANKVNSTGGEEQKDLCEQTNELNLNVKGDEEEMTTTTKKPSKAQKRREKKEQEERERQKRLAEGEQESKNHARNIEANLFAKLLKENSFKLYEVLPDGNCMYNSILAQQNNKTASEADLLDLRQRTAEYMRKHEDDFLPFMSNPTTGDMLNKDEYTKYCDDVESTSSWGGQLELRAISQCYQQRVEVHQASAPTLIVIGETFTGKPIRLSYHRHQYGLGEHYNALLVDD